MGFAQKEANYWYFGENAGLNFGSGSPVALTNGELSTMEGCSSISTSSGTLRFYTDGIKVWNKNHNQMPNGFGLQGDPSSSQSGIIVPKPASDKLYYIFTIDDVAHGPGGTYGINYSMVDMNLDGWKGDVVDTVKNINLTTPMCEKVTAVGHKNGFDTWIITQKWETNDIYAYLVTNQGVNHNPIISTGGVIINGSIDNAKGYMKVSPDGEVLAKANAGLHSIEIFDFNNITGQVTNPKLIVGVAGEPYGVEFSPDGKLLYINTWKNNGGKNLYQYDLEAGTINDIIASKYIVATGTEGALQLGPDNRIYVAMNNSGSLSRINQPNTYGVDCNFEYGTVSLGGRNSRWGLPPFIQSFFSFNAGFYNDKPCFTVPTQFYENSSQEPDSLIWNFGDPDSGDDNFSILNDPLHTFTKTGFFAVYLTVWIEGIEVGVNHLVVVADKPEINIGADSTLCDGETLFLDAGEGFDSYLWSNGDTTRSITVAATGEYWVEISIDGNCTNRDTINVEFTPNPTANAGSPQLIVMGSSTTLNGLGESGTPPYNYLWEPAGQLIQNNIQNPTTVALFAPQVYSLNISDANNCTSNQSEVLINVYEPGDALGALPFATPDTICRGEEVIISANAFGGSGDYTYTWAANTTGDTWYIESFSHKPDFTLSYLLTVEDSEGNVINSSVSVMVNPLPKIDLIPENAIIYGTDTIKVCVRDSVFLDAWSGTEIPPLDTKYLWSPSGKNDRYYLSKTNGTWIDFQTHSVQVTDGETGCSNGSGITIFYDFNECAIGIEEAPEKEIIVGVQPNPNNGKFVLTLNEDLSNLELKVMDIKGQLVFYKKFNRNYIKGEQIEMNIDFPEKGIYFIKFTSKQKQFINKILVR